MSVETNQNFVVGTKVKILENGEVVDEAIIRSVGIGGNPTTQEIEVESLKLHPGQKTQFAFIRHYSPEGWRMLFRDPMAGGRCFSQRGPTYVIDPS